RQRARLLRGRGLRRAPAPHAQPRRRRAAVSTVRRAHRILSSTAPALSVVIPLYNEADTLEPLVAELGPVLDSLGRTAEIVDGDVDVVNGWRRPRRDPWLRRRLPSALANRLISLVTGTALHDYGCTLRAMRASVARDLQLYGELHRFIPALAADLGARLVEIPVRHRPRRAGRSKYGLSRTLRVLLDLLTVKFLSGFSTRPIQLFGL